MTQRVAILNGENINLDKDFSELAMSTDGVIRGLVVTPTSVSAGKAWVKVSRDTVTPTDEFLVLFESTESVSISTTNNQYIIVEVDDTQIQTGGVEEDGTGIGEIKVVNTLPTVNYIELARTDGTGTVITTNRKVSTTIATLPHSVEYVNGDGERIGVPLGTPGQTLVSKGETSAPEFESPAVDINGLTAITTLANSDTFVVHDGSGNKKISRQNLRTNLVESFVGAKAIGASTFTLTHNSGLAIPLASEEFDTDVMHDNSTNNSRLTCKTAGYFTITGGFADGPTNWRNDNTSFLSITKNGTEVARQTMFTNTTFGIGATVSVALNLAVNDYVELVITPVLFVSSKSFTADSKTFLSAIKNNGI